ncbi:glycosyltransferase [Fodinibius salicampi]|uniref:glycosyltransferase n=1 Tax=Fodinibius salicampi TaxID=1920655 RepID=UPI0031EAB1F7
MSVIVPCFNEEDNLKFQVEALLNESWDESWEVLLCDNGSTDSTVKVIKRYSRNEDKIKYVDASKKKGVSYARNRGVEEAQGELIAFIDADDIIATGWVPAIAEGIRLHSFVASKRDQFVNDNKVGNKINTKNPSKGLIQYNYVDYLPFSGGCGLGIRRKIHEKIGGFDEELIYCEDTDYCWRVQLQGIPLIFWPKALVHVRTRESTMDLFRQGLNWGEYNALLYKKFKPYGIPNVSYLRGIKLWVKLLRRIFFLWKKWQRDTFIKGLGYRIGMLKGSIRFRVFAP